MQQREYVKVDVYPGLFSLVTSVDVFQSNSNHFGLFTELSACRELSACMGEVKAISHDLTYMGCANKTSSHSCVPQYQRPGASP